MGKGDNRRSQKMINRAGQRRKKARLARKVERVKEVRKSAKTK